MEIDAASHGGVDDARELRERATFAPARDRYKVFILDEAHMVSNQGFNALLKIVEEPPPHIKFIFATTEPDKVIGTIRSRTHHYPFRLVPPDVLVPYLQQLCDSEGVPVASGVLPLVVRAGGGSVRDTLSVLDQLIAGSGGGELAYEGAAALLGYTQASLLDDLTEAIAARDGASRVPGGRARDLDRPRAAPVRRGPAGAPARPDRHRGVRRRRRRRPARRPHRPAGPHAPAGPPPGCLRAVAVRGPLPTPRSPR